MVRVPTVPNLPATITQFIVMHSVGSAVVDDIGRPMAPASRG
jgi:hypothetical protein